MFNELGGILKLLRPRHLLKAITHPAEELRAFKYHYRRVPLPEFVAFLSGEVSPGAVKDVLSGLPRLGGLISALTEELKLHNDGYGGQMMGEAEAVYALVRLLKPEVMVETGVADGTTSSYILRAMEENGRGKLYSIDLPSSMLPAGKAPGWVVPAELRKRWELRVGDAAELLPPLLEELGEIDLFLHDSLHTYGHMLFEFRAAWPRLKAGGLLLSHDIGRNAAFFDFVSEAGLGWGDWRCFNVLGGFRKQGFKR